MIDLPVLLVWHRSAKCQTADIKSAVTEKHKPLVAIEGCIMAKYKLDYALRQKVFKDFCVFCKTIDYGIFNLPVWALQRIIARILLFGSYAKLKLEDLYTCPSWVRLILLLPRSCYSFLASWYDRVNERPSSTFYYHNINDLVTRDETKKGEISTDVCRPLVRKRRAQRNGKWTSCIFKFAPEFFEWLATRRKYRQDDLERILAWFAPVEVEKESDAERKCREGKREQIKPIMDGPAATPISIPYHNPLEPSIVEYYPQEASFDNIYYVNKTEDPIMEEADQVEEDFDMYSPPLSGHGSLGVESGEDQEGSSWGFLHNSPNGSIQSLEERKPSCALNTCGKKILSEHTGSENSDLTPSGYIEITNLHKVNLVENYADSVENLISSEKVRLASSMPTVKIEKESDNQAPLEKNFFGSIPYDPDVAKRSSVSLQVEGSWLEEGEFRETTFLNVANSPPKKNDPKKEKLVGGGGSPSSWPERAVFLEKQGWYEKQVADPKPVTGVALLEKWGCSLLASVVRRVEGLGGGGSDGGASDEKESCYHDEKPSTNLEDYDHESMDSWDGRRGDR